MSLSTSSSAPSNAKRPRTDCEDNTHQPQPVRNPDYWFEDGNIVIQAQDTQFRVHRSIMARHSTVFRDMLGLPQPEGELLLEGCPVVRLTDAPKDWEYLLSTMYDTEATYKSVDVFALPVLSAMLRLGRKYEFDKLYDAAVDRLKFELPESLAQWDEIFGRKHEKKCRVSGQEVELLNILLELGLQPFLPVAYFLCLKSMKLENTFRLLEQESRTSQLSLDSIERLVIGRVKIHQAMLNLNHAWVRDHHPSTYPHCLDKIQCEKSRLDALVAFSRGMIGMNSVGRALLRDGLYLGFFCKGCEVPVVASYEAGRHKIWDSLPTYFGLPAWESLK